MSDTTRETGTPTRATKPRKTRRSASAINGPGNEAHGATAASNGTASTSNGAASPSPRVPPSLTGKGDRELGGSANEAEWREKTFNPAVERNGEREADFTTSSDSPSSRSTPRTTSPTGTRARLLASPANIPTPAASSPPCIAAASGPCASTPAIATAEESNQRYRYLLEHGTLASPSPSTCPRRWATTPITRWPRARSARSASPSPASRICASSSPASPSRRITTSMTINATAAILLALYLAVAREQGADVRTLSGTVQNDILKEYIARGTYIYPPPPRCASSPTSSATPQPTFPSGTPSPSPATTSARPAPPPPKRSASPSPTASPMSRPRSTPG